jgi:hypothetical protein
MEEAMMAPSACLILQFRPPARRSAWPRLALMLAIAGFGADSVAADAPTLTAQIDQMILDANAGVAAPTVSDAEFLRRASLDLIGVPPKVEELRAFLADQSPEKRVAAVDRLLAHPRYARHMAEVFDVMFMERRPSVHVTADEWHKYLLQAFRENRPYNELAKEILSADGAEPEPRAAGKFYLDRLADPHLLTRDVGRVFFGQDLQCAQCHDHPVIDDYHQADYHGLMAFFSSGALFTAPAPDGKAYYVENAGKELEFESVFAKGEKHSTGAKMPGLAELEEPALYPDELYEVKPAANVRPVPKFSRRAKLAELATSGTNREFNENIANRLWAHLMGRGLVDPVDLHHSSNPPSNPALLKLLGEQFAAGGFNVKEFLRSLALTQTYQRSIDPPADPIAVAPVAAELAGKLESRVQELEAATEAADEQYEQEFEECSSIDETAMPVKTELVQATAAAAEAAAKLEAAQQQLAAAKAQVDAKTAASQALAEAVAKTQEATKVLPQDQELLAAAQKFLERQQQVAAEIPPLAEAAKKKEEEVKAPSEAMAASKQAIDAVRQKFAPLAESIRQQAQEVEAARQAWMEKRTVRVRSEEQLEATKQLAALKPLKDQLASAQAQVAAAETALAAARAAAEANQAAIAAAQQAVAPADEQAKQTAAATAAAQAELDKWRPLTVAIEEAAAKADAAQKLLPGDDKLAKAGATLAEKLAELQQAEQAPREALAAATTAQQAADQQLAAATLQVQTLTTEKLQHEQAIAAADKAAAEAKALAAARQQELDDTLVALNAEWSESFAVFPLKPLTPEQLCWSIFQVTGVYDRTVAAERAEMDKTAPLAEADKADPAKVAARELELQQRVYDKLKGSVAVFVSLYAPAAGQPQSDFFATANQALFAANGGSITAWTAPAGGNVTERAIQQADPKVAAEEMYLSVLGRMPDEAEVADVAQYLAEKPEEKAARVQELVWGLLTSVEFRFNH